MIDLAILDPHEIQIFADKKPDIAVPEARGQEKFRIAIQMIANGIDRQDKTRHGFGIHGFPSVVVDGTA